MSIELSDLGELGEAIKAEIARAAKESVSECLSKAGESSEKAKQIKETLEIIMSKKFLTADETAFLFNCGSDKIYTLVKEAKSGKSKHPIPFTPLGETGMVRFERTKLLEWAMKQKTYESPKTKQT